MRKRKEQKNKGITLIALVVYNCTKRFRVVIKKKS